jgi:hypothetical protein
MNPIRENLPVVLATSGAILMFFGVGTMPHLGLYFSTQSATLVLLGGAALTSGFLAHSELSRESPEAQKIYVLLICTAIMLFATGIVAYMVVHVDYEFHEISYTIGPYSAGSGIEAIPIINHIYASHSAILILTALVVALSAQYIKYRML